MNPIFLLLKKISPELLVFFVCVFVSSYISYHVGSMQVENQWNQDKLAKIATIDALRNQLKEKEQKYIEENSRIQKELADAQKQYEISVTHLHDELNNKLQQSEERIRYYQSQAKQSASGCRNLANVASRLDSSLTEGIQLVKELTEHIKLRDKQLQSVGQKLINEKSLTE